MPKSSSSALSVKSFKKHYVQSMDYLKGSSTAVLADLGIDTKAVHSIRDIPQQFRNFSTKNPTTADFLKNSECALYEVREDLKWKTSMARALLRKKWEEQEAVFRTNFDEQQIKYREMIRDRLKFLRPS